MNPLMQQMQSWLGPNAKAIRALMAPLVVVMILAMMVLPLPPFALDLLFTFNIAMALMVMMVAAYMVRPLDFAAFPAVILLTTLLRLSLNVASTRVVLLAGPHRRAAAGKVIESFGHFLVGGNFAVGLIVFAILVVINFVVVTKGAERIAEVGARFTLDAMPGKQMAIDADMNAGLIDEKEAKRRRAEVGDEAEFFGSMDGASKYVRGDAMAGLLDPLHQHHRRLRHRRRPARPHRVAGGRQLHPARGRRRAGRADPGAADLGGGGDGRLARRQGRRTSAARSPSRCSRRRARSPSSPACSRCSARSRACRTWSSCSSPPASATARGCCTSASRRAKNAPKPAPPPLEANAEATWDDLQPVDTLGLEVGYRLIALVDKAAPGRPARRASRACGASSRRTSASCRRRCTSATTSS